MDTPQTALNISGASDRPRASDTHLLPALTQAFGPVLYQDDQRALLGVAGDTHA